MITNLLRPSTTPLPAHCVSVNPCTIPQHEIRAAAALLRAGKTVAFPTETVYGLGADAMNPEAVRRVFAIKGRPADHPLIVHLATAEWLDEWARDISAPARLLAEIFWPGPLTLVLPRQPWVPDAVTGGQDSVALRVPQHPVALDIIATSGALAAPSANRFGRVSPTTAEHVRAELGEAVDMILEGGPCRMGVESTIVSLLHGEPVLLRPGGVSVADLEAVLGTPLATGIRRGGVRVPGMHAAHYAPATPLEVHAAPDIWRHATELAGRGLDVAVMRLGSEGAGCADFPCTHREAMPTCAADYARALYATLRKLDAAGFHVLLAETPPDTPEWLAVRDRLARAARNPD
jgi:L-threonylcarbamoyladenylate synthase